MLIILRLKMETIGQRLDYVRIQHGMSWKELADLIGNISGDAIRKAVQKEKIKEVYLNKVSDELGISSDWLKKNIGDWKNRQPNNLDLAREYLQSQYKEIKVNNPLEMDYTENRFNQYLKVGERQYVMVMPLLGYSAQAGFLDNQQDAEFIAELEKHSIITEKPRSGKYVAFRAKGQSMDNGVAGEAIQHGNIITGRELQKHLWKNKLHLHKFKNWVIYTTKSSMPIVKEIVSHDVEKGIIKCRSLNTAPEYQDFELSLNDVTGLFNVVDVSWKPIDG